MTGERILIVEDEPALVVALEDKLGSEGFLTTVARDGVTAQRLLALASPDLVLLDLMLPGLDGISLLRWLRIHDRRVPVLIMSARDREEHKIEGLRAGADDYLAKPFGVGELLARIAALLRRARGDVETVRCGALEIELDGRRVRRNGAEIILTTKELELVLYLARHRGRTLRREVILQNVWGDDPASDVRAVDYHMLNIRKKLEDDPSAPRHFLTRRGRGYELASE